jgi:hypothetical protein
MRWVYNDGGRAAAGYKGDTGDCVTRAIAIAAQLPYQKVYDAINAVGKLEKQATGRGSNARTGVIKSTTRAFIKALGWRWVPTMKFGTGCTVHLREHELPKGRLIVQVSKHLVAVIDGVMYDTHDPSREGTRCVYGYYVKEA